MSSDAASKSFFIHHTSHSFLFQRYTHGSTNVCGVRSSERWRGRRILMLNRFIFMLVGVYSLWVCWCDVEERVSRMGEKEFWLRNDGSGRVTNERKGYILRVGRFHSHFRHFLLAFSRFSHRKRVGCVKIEFFLIKLSAVLSFSKWLVLEPQKKNV